MAGRPIWYELMTPDARDVAPFYRAVLRWSIPDDAARVPSGSEYRMIGRADGGAAGGVLTLTKDMQSGGAEPGWLPYFHVDDVDAALANATKLGGKQWMPPQNVPGAGRIAMLSDPQGAAFYVMKPTPPPGRPDAQSDLFDVKKAGHCRWNELVTNDALAAQPFYASLLGWTIDQKMSMGSAGDYLFVDSGDTRIGAIGPMIRQAAKPSWLLYFGVEDIARAEVAVTTNGGKVVREPNQIPGGEYSFVATDPGGALVAFVGPRAV
ncbi:MAG: VOC family protein [Gammaproteobacteria bacterium]